MKITPDMERLIELAIMEDYSAGDATTEALISLSIDGKAVSYTHLRAHET